MKNRIFIKSNLKVKCSICFRNVNSVNRQALRSTVVNALARGGCTGLSVTPRIAEKGNAGAITAVIARLNDEEAIVRKAAAEGGAAQAAAVGRVQHAVVGWDFSAEAAEVENLAKQPVIDYSLGKELHAACDTVPELVKLPGRVGSTHLLDLLPAEWAAHYACESRQ